MEVFSFKFIGALSDLMLQRRDGLVHSALYVGADGGFFPRIMLGEEGCFQKFMFSQLFVHLIYQQKSKKLFLSSAKIWVTE